MTRWFFLFLLAIILVLSFRLFTFSSAPIVQTSCEEVSIASKLSGVWNLNRIDNFSGFSPYLKRENTEDYSLIINSTFPFLLSNSQILIVNICGEEMSISYNYFRNWQQYSFSLLENKKFNKISVFMNVFDCHVNRTPCAGKIEEILYKPGAFVNASLDKASEDNERNYFKIKDSDNNDVIVVQIAGLVARRIVCESNKNQELKQGDRIGMIRFGSRADVYYENYQPLVKVGQKAISGETLLAKK